MLNKLDELIASSELRDLFDLPSAWQSLIINRRKPYTYRAFTMIGDLRISLHRFDECSLEESFLHPHPWPGAFKILAGSYDMQLGYSDTRSSDMRYLMKLRMSEGSAYEITDPLVWHSVTPLEPTYTIMLNGAPWPGDVVHCDVRTTRGKDLEQMSAVELWQHLSEFKEMLF